MGIKMFFNMSFSYLSGRCVEERYLSRRGVEKGCLSGRGVEERYLSERGVEDSGGPVPCR
jgi:hypothetical protein